VAFCNTLKITDQEQNMIGMSVVGSDFEKLKRFNLAELRDSTRGKDENITNVKEKSAKVNEPATRIKVVEETSKE
jgi:hypothetical protein